MYWWESNSYSLSQSIRIAMQMAQVRYAQEQATIRSLLSMADGSGGTKPIPEPSTATAGWNPQLQLGRDTAAAVQWGNNFMDTTVSGWEQERQAAYEEQGRAVDAYVRRQAALFNDYITRPSHYIRDAQGIRLRGAYNPEFGPALR